MGTGLKVSTFKDRFTSLFEESDKTITELSKDLHVSNQTISAWKTGTRSPKEPTIIAIADHFHVNVQWLMGFDVDKEQSTRSMIEKEFMEYYNEHGYPPSSLPKTREARSLAKGMDKMPEAQRKAIMAMMTGLYPGLFEGEEDDET